DRHRGRLEHGRPAGSRGGASRRTLVGSQRLRGALHRREAAPGTGGWLRGDHHLRPRRSLLRADEMGKEVHVVNASAVKLTRAVLGKIEAHARASYAKDEEACGYVTGP